MGRAALPWMQILRRGAIAGAGAIATVAVAIFALLSEADAAALWLADDAPGHPGRACRHDKAAALSFATVEVRT